MLLNCHCHGMVLLWMSVKGTLPTPPGQGYPVTSLSWKVNLRESHTQSFYFYFVCPAGRLHLVNMHVFQNTKVSQTSSKQTSTLKDLNSFFLKKKVVVKKIWTAAFFFVRFFFLWGADTTPIIPVCYLLTPLASLYVLGTRSDVGEREAIKSDWFTHLCYGWGQKGYPPHSQQKVFLGISLYWRCIKHSLLEGQTGQDNSSDIFTI